MTEIRLVDTPQAAVDAAEDCLREFGYEVTGDCAVHVAHAVLSAAPAAMAADPAAQLSRLMRLAGELDPGSARALRDHMLDVYGDAPTVTASTERLCLCKGLGATHGCPLHWPDEPQSSAGARPAPGERERLLDVILTAWMGDEPMVPPPAAVRYTANKIADAVLSALPGAAASGREDEACQACGGRGGFGSGGFDHNHEWMGEKCDECDGTGRAPAQTTPGPWHYGLDVATGRYSLWHREPETGEPYTVTEIAHGLTYPDAELILRLRARSAPSPGGQAAGDEADGRDAEFWRDSYVILRDAVTDHLPSFIHGGEEAEEVLLADAISRAAAALRAAERGVASGDTGASHGAERLEYTAEQQFREEQAEHLEERSEG